jgi:hypothetical protein
MPAETPVPDATVERLADLFARHRAWIRAAGHLEASATSTVFFAHRPGEAWRLAKRDGRTVLVPGAAADPDFVFCFTPESVDQLVRTEGSVGDFAVTLFRLITEEDPRLRIGFRIVAPFARLVRRGYLAVLAAGGMRVLAFGAARGVRTLAELKRLVDRSRSDEPADWECVCPPRPEEEPLDPSHP